MTAQPSQLDPSAPPLARTASPHSTKPQYFLSFAVLGAIVPFLSVLLAERGLDKEQIGKVWAVSSLGVIFTPILITFLADAAIAPRILMAGLFTLAGGFLIVLGQAWSFGAILALYSLHLFALQPVYPLQDGIHFAAQSLRRAAGLAETPYHTVRVWGTIGYIVPGLLLLFLLRPGQSTTPILWCAAGFCAAGAVNALLLPRTPPRERARQGLPTAAALRAIGEPHVLIFCVAMFLIHMASQAYYQFYPLHLTDRSGIDRSYVGMIANVGVVVEIFFMLGFAWLLKRLTLRRLMYLGSLAIGVRMYLLAAFDHPAVAIGVQLLHGLTVLVIHVAPPIFLNARAEDRYRNSMQGLYTMVFAGLGKVIGAWGAGRVAHHWSLQTAFFWSATICVAATAMFYLAFEEKQVHR